MTYRELYDKAEWKLEKGEITIGEFDELTKPLDEEIRPRGKWLNIEDTYCVCSNCKWENEHWQTRFVACPWCGADMREGDDK